MNILPKIGDKVSLTQKAYDAIKDAIMSNKFKPGELLIEERLAKQLAISRTPLRSALKMLAYEHLVTINSSRNVIVSSIDKNDIDNITVVRESLEVAVIKQLQFNITEKQIKELDRMLKDQIEACQNENYELFIDLEYKFHVSMAEFTRNKWMYEMVKNINTIVQRYLILSGSLKRYAQIALEEHEKILKAIKDCDYRKASYNMKWHITNVSKRMLE
ncbi:GntR family transcriptional regulator [Clostridium kluyveri]|uniref:GntR family transcriptional regulator n=1 Tax=Clostridium kluyveri TaxID=1534 RepID=A0A1L5F524_CLOKL|nr:GntR family transcriptional regulator [Clostridium kluyveri]APM38121.1 GntR family transcriptional regulator [Clostridium kluyveri]UZQ51869.1 GntR family transcriptional regulator [Clostridium kluyveri]